MGLGRSIHAVAAEAHAFCWDNAIAPALECASGEEIQFSVRDASGGQLDEHSTTADVAGLNFSRVNPVSGPVFVKDARPGDVLQVDLLEFHPRGFGWTAIIPGFGLLADEFTEPWLRLTTVDGSDRVRFGEHVTLPFRPFPGTIGVAPPEPGEHSIVPPRQWGGNMDTRHLEAGTTLYLPVGVEGALFSVGDTHACQGDGEVCGTAIESGMEVVLRLSVRRDFSVDAPQFALPAVRELPGAHHVCTGVGPDLMEAARDAVRAAIVHLGERRGLEREEAYAVVSVACDLRIHEVVDVPNWVVGCFIPDAIFEGG